MEAVNAINITALEVSRIYSGTNLFMFSIHDL